MSESHSTSHLGRIDILGIPFEALEALPDEQAAEVLNDRMLAWDQVDDLKELSFADRGRIALAFQKRSLWQHLTYHSFEAWMTSGRGGSRTTKYAALGAIKHLQDVPAEALASIPRCNVATLVGVSTATRQLPEVLEAARGSEEEFRDYLATNHPNQHILPRQGLKFRLEYESCKLVNEALDMAIEDGIASDRNEALLKIAEVAIEVWKTDRMLAQNEDFQKMVAEDVPKQRVM